MTILILNRFVSRHFCYEHYNFWRNIDTTAKGICFAAWIISYPAGERKIDRELTAFSNCVNRPSGPDTGVKCHPVIKNVTNPNKQQTKNCLSFSTVGTTSHIWFAKKCLFVIYLRNMYINSIAYATWNNKLNSK